MESVSDNLTFIIFIVLAVVLLLKKYGERVVIAAKQGNPTSSILKAHDVLEKIVRMGLYLLMFIITFQSIYVVQSMPDDMTIEIPAKYIYSLLTLMLFLVLYVVGRVG